MTGGHSATRRYRWIILLLAWAALTMACFDRAMWSITAPVAATELGLPPALALGVFVSATQTGYLLALLLGSLAADWIGPRPVLTVALLWLGCSVLGFSRIDGIEAGLVVQFCLGMGAAPVFAIGIKLLLAWFDRQRATAISLFMTALSMPTILVNILVPVGIGLVGWRGNYVLVGLATILLGLICALLVRNAPAAADEAPAPTGRPSLRPLLANRDYRWLVVANMAGPWASWGLMIWSNLLLVDRFHIPIAQSGTIVAGYGFGAFLSLLLSGMIIDRLKIDQRIATIGSMALFSVALLAFGWVEEVRLIGWIMPVMGFIAYAYGPPLNAMIAGTAGRMAASAAGLATLLTFAAEGLQPLLIGALYQHSGSFLMICSALAAGPAIGAVAVWRTTRSGPRASPAPAEAELS